MDFEQLQELLKAMYSLSRMIDATQTYPFTDCPDVHPTFNICGSCAKYPFCTSKWEFTTSMNLVAKRGD